MELSSRQSPLASLPLVGSRAQRLELATRRRFSTLAPFRSDGFINLIVTGG